MFYAEQEKLLKIVISGKILDKLKFPFALWTSRAVQQVINWIFSVTNQGKVSFMIYNQTIYAQIFIKFCRSLIKGTGKKIYLILDNLCVHHRRIVKQGIAQQHQKIELFFSPLCSPEHNQNEKITFNLKAISHSGVPAPTKGQQKSKAILHLRMLQKKPNRVKKYSK
jgi:hypothetical protein